MPRSEMDTMRPSIVFGGIAEACLLGLAALFGPAAFGATVLLSDGTVIQGEIESLHDDVYTIDTEALGEIHIRRENVRRIDYGGATGAETSPVPISLPALQEQLLQSEQIMSMIQALQSDPEIRAVLADPEILAAIASGNYETLLNNPKILALASHDKIREIVEAAQ